MATVRSGDFMRKIAIITGASSGIGATAVALAERGVDSIVTFDSHADRVRDVVEAVRQRGAKAVPLRLDVGENASFIAFRDEVIAVLDSEWKASSFDYLVNNAGFLQMALFEDTTEELFETFMRVLFKGPYFLTQALLPVSRPLRRSGFARKCAEALPTAYSSYP
jgi:NAD(P)-dependent dehydrogenase (short-subunit alcohol dehydrogenase family)